MLFGSRAGLALAALALALAGAAQAETPQTLRCVNTLIVSTPQGYHTYGEGDLYLDIVAKPEAPGAFDYRVHPGVFPSIALGLRDCVTATCTGITTRDSYSLASKRSAAEAVVTIDIGRVNAQYVATAETRDRAGHVVRVLTERGACEPAPSAQKF